MIKKTNMDFIFAWQRKWNAMAQLIEKSKQKSPGLVVTTYLKTYASIWSFRLKLIISHRTDFNKASHIDLE